ncbi:AAA family ATPase [Patescibacteria group bacterium]|nr:AAA family ATPase [Patescibacteria group bacterium]
MFLEKLEINGFKSFAHKVDLEFKPGITAVVGPNGSGKSNIADSVRWVLGEQSLKLLRGKKSEDIIFSGSDKKARLGMAEVSLYFNNFKDKANIGMSEICITRKLYRNGDSEYLINKQKARLTDIHMLLAKAGVARTSYSIIGQGMIDNFLLASPQERKEFFEEASGVKSLQIKRGQTLNKLEHTEENLETASIQLQEITPRLNSLTRQVKRLERRVEVESTLKNLQFKYYSAIWREINNKWKEKHNQLKDIAKDQESIQDEIGKSQKELANLTKNNIKSDTIQKLQNEYQEAMNSKMQLNLELSNLKIKAVREVQKKVNQKNIPYEVGQEILGILGGLEKLTNEIKEILKNKDLELVEKKFIKQSEILEKLSKILEPYKNSSEATTQDVKLGFKTQFNSQNDIVKKLEQKILELDEKINNIQEKIKTENNKEKEERSQIWQVQQKYQIEQQKLNSISSQVNDLRVELARLETKKDDLEQDIKQELDFDVRLDDVKLGFKTQHSLNEHEKRAKITEIAKLKHQLELIGGIDPEVQMEYEQIKERHEFLSGQIEDLKNSMNALEKLILELDESIKKQFEISFKVINEEFQKHFKTLFAGGKAKLILLKDEQETRNKKQETNADENNLEKIEDVVDEEKTEFDKISDRLSQNMYSGVEIEATPPGKKLKSINMLSGGERALTSIALLCAILSANPSPFIILDEVDAALDEANSIRYADIIEQLSSKSQFVIITHNRATMEKADILYGVTMGDDGVSTLLSLKLETAEKYTNR